MLALWLAAPRGSRCSKLTPQIEHKPPSRLAVFQGSSSISHRASREALVFLRCGTGWRTELRLPCDGDFQAGKSQVDKGLYDRERLGPFAFYGEGA